MQRIRSFLEQAVRVLRLARKPTKEEFMRMAKITAAGIIVIGAIGYLFQAIYVLLVTGGIP